MLDYKDIAQARKLIARPQHAKATLEWGISEQDSIEICMYLVGQIQSLGVPVNEVNNWGE